MKIPLLAALVAVSILALGGCAEMRWTKPGADAAAVSRDLDECRGRALALSAPPAAAGATLPDQPVDRGGTPVGRPASTANERFIAEHEDIRICMQRRGYQLQPAS